MWLCLISVIVVGLLEHIQEKKTLHKHVRLKNYNNSWGKKLSQSHVIRMLYDWSVKEFSIITPLYMKMANLFTTLGNFHSLHFI